MQQQRTEGLDGWAAFLGHAEIPVLKQTARNLAELRKDAENLGVREVEAIARDPMMTVKLLRHLQKNKRKVQATEVIQAEQALLMLGIEPFFGKIPHQPLVEETLKPHIAGLYHLLLTVLTASGASLASRLGICQDWAARPALRGSAHRRTVARHCRNP